MQDRALCDSQKQALLEKSIRGYALSAEQKIVVDYLKMRFSSVLTKWLAGVEQADPERLRGEAACLKELIQILSNAPMELVEGDN